MPKEFLEANIRDWKNALESITEIEDDIEKLEAHLVDEISGLRVQGLTDEEAFIIATQRIGQINGLSRAYFVSMNELWKRLSVPVDTTRSHHWIWLTMALAMMAAIFSQIPYLFGGSYFNDGSEKWLTLVSFWLLPSLVTYFAYRHHIGLFRIIAVCLAYGSLFLFVTFFPFASESSTHILVLLHLPFLSWLMFLPLTREKILRSISAVLYLRLTGEAFLYAVLLALGGVTLLGFTSAIFISANINIEQILTNHIGVAGLFGIPIVAMVLADQKRQFVESFIPILARIFVPLFIVSIAAFLLTIAAMGTSPSGDRELLLVMNILLLLVVAMLFYDVSAMEGTNTRRASNWANFVLVVTALVLDVVVLSAISSRLLEFGTSPNRLAVFGLNVILIVHLVMLTAKYAMHLMKRIRFQEIESTVTRLLPVYGIWLLVIVVVFPVLFAGR
ncbi:MAG: hypothetical protein V2J62_02455 [candidate division KSB1 bacterium]|jgi:hypothetical protein|nr:hypothetical protein [candidate division KSB1 bacterium]